MKYEVRAYSFDALLDIAFEITTIGDLELRLDASCLIECWVNKRAFEILKRKSVIENVLANVSQSGQRCESRPCIPKILREEERELLQQRRGQLLTS